MIQEPRERRLEIKILFHSPALRCSRDILDNWCFALVFNCAAGGKMGDCPPDL
jgi:hypothetical protein